MRDINPRDWPGAVGPRDLITNGPYADTVVFYAKLDDGSGTPIRDRQVPRPPP
jgi:hypothetical protein